ncbi:MAG TPA: glycosyltransferase family 39 protein [Abditibacterium sp.]|jgi:hypothetical protein
MISPPNPEHEQATKSPSKPLLAFAVLFGFALLVRVAGLSWGLPNENRWYSYHPDESTRQMVGAVVSLLGGDFNPHFFNYPSLSIYATWLIYQFLAGFGLLTDAVSPQYPWPVVRDIILAGRIFSVICGALTVPLVWAIARLLGMRKAAVLAGILVALTPGHVQHSHFATVDVPATFFVVLCIYLTLRAQNRKQLLWAALVAGLAAGTKYNAGLVVLAPLLRAWSPSFAGAKNGIWPLMGAQIVLAALGFLISTPYSLLAPREFWGNPAQQMGFAYELLHHPREGSGEIFQQTGNGWIYHFTFNLPFVLTWPLIIGALVGLVFAARKREWWPVLAFLGVFFLSLGFSQVRFMRYLLPLAPILVLLAAYGASRLPFARIWGGVLAAFALIGSSNVLWPFLQPDPRDFEAGLLRSSFSRGETIATINNPWYFTPPFQPRGDNQSVERVAVVGTDIEKLRTANASFLVLSELEIREAIRLRPNGIEAQFLKKVTQNQREKRWIRKHQIPFALPGRAFVPHDYLYTNPETRVYSFPAPLAPQ